MKSSILLASLLTLTIALPAVLHSSKASSAVPVQELAAATKLPLKAGTVLKKGTKLTSPSGKHLLVVGVDGNLMIVKDGVYVWGTNQVIPNFGDPAAPGVDRVEFRTDGRLTSYNDKGVAVWTAPVTRPDPNATLDLNDDGVLQLVAANGEILWAHNAVRAFVKKANTLPCADKEGWDSCVELADPKIKIFSTRGTSASAVNAVANIYTEMMNRLKPTSVAKRKFDGFKVYITNMEPWDVQKLLPVVGTMWPGDQGKILQGGANNNFLWITEKAIAKVLPPGDGRGSEPDLTFRTFDQVVHEMAHSIDFKLVDDQDINQFTGGQNSAESFAFRVQQWFAVPAGQIPPAEEAILKRIFSSRAVFSIEGYNPPAPPTPPTPPTGAALTVQQLAEKFRAMAVYDSPIDADNPNYDLINEAVYFVTNEARVKQGKSLVPYHPLLAKAAFDYAREMVTKDFFDHNHPSDPAQRTPSDRGKRAGIKNAALAENIATSFGIQYEAGKNLYTMDATKGIFSYTSPEGPAVPMHTYRSLAQSLVDQWMKSPGHRANILSDDNRSFGCGVYFFRDQNFNNMLKVKAVQKFQRFNDVEE